MLYYLSLRRMINKWKHVFHRRSISFLQCFSAIQMPNMTRKTAVRCLYTDDWFNIPACKVWRDQMYYKRNSVLSYMNVLMSEEYITKHIHPDDLRDFLAIVDVSDLDFLERVIHKIAEDGNHSMSTTIARVYFVLNQPERAFSLITNRELIPFFSHVKSYAIIMQLLYNFGKYKEVCEVFHHLHQHRHTYPSMCVTLTHAANYKINSKLSLAASLQLCDEMYERGMEPLPKQLALVAGLALKLGREDWAFELCNPKTSLLHRPFFEMGSAVRTIQIISLARLGRFEEAISLLSKYSKMGRGATTTYMCKEAVDELMSALCDVRNQSTMSQTKIDEFKENVHLLEAHMMAEGRFGQEILSLEKLVTTPVLQKNYPHCERARSSWKQKKLMNTAT